MSKTEKRLRLCLRIMHRLVRRWYEEQGIKRVGDSERIEQYASICVGWSNEPVCNITLDVGKYPKHKFIELDEKENVV